MATAAFRAFPLDGAMSWFQPSTGAHVRWDGPETRALTQVAPRVVMLSLSHACNLACAFCSRDPSVATSWTADSAADLLRELAARRVLEVSLGGGEPLAFRGLSRLLDRLHDETPLAVHLTTNGVLLDDARVARLRGRVGEVRVSVYDDTPWEDRVARLADGGVRAAANVLVIPERLAALPSVLERLRRAGARDVALLSYVGPDRALHLGVEHDAALAEIVAESRLPARLSVCLGRRLDPLPLASLGGCGAGLDFVTLDPDRRVRACSFSDEGFPADTADDVLAVWRHERARLAAPSPRRGCARGAEASGAPSDGVRVYRAFSGNNSGDCVLVGRFDEAADARAYVDALLPGFAAGERYSPAWDALLRAEGVTPQANEYAPDAMLALGRAVLLHTDSTLADDYPSLRELLWRRGGRAVYNGVHEHGQIQLLVGLRAPDPARARAAAEARLEAPFTRHGQDAYGALRVFGQGDASLGAYGRDLDALAVSLGATIAGELVAETDLSVPRLLPSLARGRDGGPGAWLWARFFDERTAAEAAARLSPDEGLVAASKHSLLLRVGRARPRLAARLQRAGANVTVVAGARVRVTCTFYTGYREPKPSLEGARAGLRAELEEPFDARLSFESPVVTLVTADPGRALAAAARVAEALGCALWPRVGPVDAPAAALRRVRDDLVALSPPKRRG